MPHSDHQHSDRNVPVADRVLEIVRAPEGEQGITSGALCAARNFSRSPRLPQGYSKGESLIVLFQQQVQINFTGPALRNEILNAGHHPTSLSRYSLSRYDYARWLGEEPDPRDLMRPFPAGLMRMWPISTRVNKPENDDPSILDPIQVTTDAA